MPRTVVDNLVDHVRACLVVVVIEEHSPLLSVKDIERDGNVLAPRRQRLAGKQCF
eukprot:SAG22_NODE_10426_length_536_cov_1.057208_2_plen_54_part_01